MAFEPGSMLGTYEIGPLAGRGGMGEVYRARDTRLKRSVAIKILPAEFARDADRVRRFQQEAEALAALNHPNVAAIYAVEEANGVRFLVLEFVEGETLAERLRRGPLPAGEALAIGLQICQALASAHDGGIVHRDLKPANIKIAPDGRVKLLDFGLARVFAQDVDGGDPSNSPTMTGGSLGRMIVGTAAYMAPEQARGRAVDKRADIWALGCVFCEMLTGQQVFAGETTTDILAAVVTREPDFARLPAGTPPQLRWLLTRCLQKDANLRFRDAADAAALLGATFEPASGSARTGGRSWIAAAVVSLLAAGAVTAAILRSSPLPQASRPVRFDIQIADAPIAQHIAISPDGRRVVYLAADANGGNALWMRPLDSLEARPIRGTENLRGNVSPFWSPDNRSIAFIGDSKLKTIDSSGGTPQTLLPVNQFCCGTWSRDGKILFATNDHGLRVIPGTGGEAVEATERDKSLEETWHDCPSFLPDGRHFLYLAYSETKPENRWVYLGSLDDKSKARTRLMPSSSCVVYAAPGYIVFPRERTLMARPFDADRLAFTGDAVPVVEDLAVFSGGELGAFGVSDSGTLIYRKDASQAAGRRLVWMDRNGRASPPIGEAVRSLYVRLSPDGRRAAFSEGSNGAADDIWVDDLDRGVKTRLTTDPATDHGPVWSPDGSRIIFDSHRGKSPTLYEIKADGATREQALEETEPGMAHAARDWSRDGRFLAFIKSVGGGSPPWDLWILPLTGDRTPFPYIVSPFDESAAAIAPDGRWLAYTTNESGRYQVVVQTFPNPSGGKWQISTNGGAAPRWRRDGKELYYLAPGGGLVAVEVTSDQKFEIGKSTTLFQTPLGFSGADPPSAPFDVTADGQRFLFMMPVGTPASTPITTILNWTSALKQAN